MNIFHQENLWVVNIFINYKISEELLDENLYLGFDKLKEKLDQIKYVENDELCEDININYYNMSYNDLFIYFSNLDEENKIKMKDSEAYKYFL